MTLDVLNLILEHVAEMYSISDSNDKNSSKGIQNNQCQ